MRTLIIAPHPDDEILGCGGTIAKLAAEGNDVFVAIATKGKQPMFSEEFIAQGRKEALAAHQLLGVKETIFCDLPAAFLENTDHNTINQEMLNLMNHIQPDLLLVPFFGDIHLDHQRIFISSLVAARPNNHTFPKKILSYETLSETNWNAAYLTPAFHPNVFFNISNYLDLKLKAFACYQSQLKEFPHERSITALQSLAQLRGSTVFCQAAEAFVLIREVIT